VQMMDPVSAVAEHLSVFQRTPQWVIPTPNVTYSDRARAWTRRLPLLSKLPRWYWTFVGEQFGKAALREGWQRRFIDKACQKYLDTVVDPELRRKLTPDYRAMCKRMIVSDNYYEALQRDNVSVLETPIASFDETGINLEDGSHEAFDVIVLATGFYPNAWGVKNIVNAEGVSLEDRWNAGDRSYKSIAVPDFPNFFMLIGPNSPVTNLSLIEIADIGVDYIMQFVNAYRVGEITAASPRRDVTRAFTDRLKRSFKGTIWVSGCNSWYLDVEGVPMTWPWPPAEFRKQLKRVDWDDYEVKLPQRSVA